MKTVLFIDRSNALIGQSYLRYDFLLEEYAAAGTFIVCDWYPEGNSVATAIPDLPAILTDDESWRAVVVADLRDKGIRPWDDRHFDNPFDFPESYSRGIDAALEESKRPVVRLAQMLGGLPEKTMVSWPDIEAMKEGETLEVDGDVLADSDGRPNALGVNSDYLGITYLQSEGYYEMMERYRLGAIRPESIVIITPREIDEDLAADQFAKIEREKRDAKAYERELLAKSSRSGDKLSPEEQAVLDGETPVGFWQRNDYPASVRFVVCDQRATALPGEETDAAQAKDLEGHGEQPLASRRDEWFRYWLCVLSLIVGNVDSLSLRPFVIHRMDVDIDEADLNAVFSRRYAEWSAVRVCIADEQKIEEERLRTSEYRMESMPDCETAISVEFDQVDGRSLEANTSEVGLLKDAPRPDALVWGEQRDRIYSGFRTLLRAPRRGTYNAAMQFRNQNAIDPETLEYCVLNQYQCDGLSDQLREQEYELARDVRPQSFSFATYKSRIDEGGERIASEMEKRASGKQVAYVGILALVAVMVGFVPFIFGLAGGVGANISAFLITLAVCLVLAITVIVTLVRMRNEVLAAYHDLNASMHSILDSLYNEAKRLGRRISSYATFKKRFSVLERQWRRGEPTERSIQLGEKDALLRTRMDDACKLLPSIKAEPVRYGEVIRGGWKMADDLLSRDAFFSVCEAVPVPCTLNGGTAFQSDIYAPYSFINDIELVVEPTV